MGGVGKKKEKKKRVNGQTERVLGGDVGSHEEDKSFAVELKGGYPMTSTEGQTGVDKGAEERLNRGSRQVKMLHPGDLGVAVGGVLDDAA